jgi:hypothetical protein
MPTDHPQGARTALQHADYLTTAAEHVEATPALVYVRLWPKEARAAAAELRRLHQECEALSESRLLRLVCDLRFALGDDGKRMQGELVEFAKGLRAERDAALAELAALRVDAGWIPVSERLPKEDEYVLCWWSASKVEGAAWVRVEFDGSARWYYMQDGDVPSKPPTHWRPLPAPPAIDQSLGKQDGSKG